MLGVTSPGAAAAGVGPAVGPGGAAAGKVHAPPKDKMKRESYGKLPLI